jgi:hypothetical protein
MPRRCLRVRGLLVVLLMGALAVGGLTACMGDDDGSAGDERRAGALGEEPGDPGEPGGTPPSSAPKLTMTVFSQYYREQGYKLVATGHVSEYEIVNGRRLSPVSDSCRAGRLEEGHPALPGGRSNEWVTGRTCTWEYQRNPCPAHLECTIVVDLRRGALTNYDERGDTQVEWGCSSKPAWNVCRVILDRDRTLTVKFVDPTPDGAQGY